MIYSTDAIVLNNKKFSDSSLICNLYSKDYGKLSIIAKGVRKLKNLNGAILQPFKHIQLLIYLGYKPLIEKCYNCNQRLKNGFFNYTSGQLECSKCANSKIELNSNSIRLINLFFNTHIDKIKQLFKLDEQSLNNINKYFFHYILHHIPNMKKSKAYMNYNQKI